MASVAIVPADIYNTSHSDLSVVEERAFVVEIVYYGGSPMLSFPFDAPTPNTVDPNKRLKCFIRS